MASSAEPREVTTLEHMQRDSANPNATMVDRVPAPSAPDALGPQAASAADVYHDPDYVEISDVVDESDVVPACDLEVNMEGEDAAHVEEVDEMQQQDQQHRDVCDFWDQWERDSDGNLHERSQDPIEVPDFIPDPGDVFSASELQEMMPGCPTGSTERVLQERPIRCISPCSTDSDQELLKAVLDMEARQSHRGPHPVWSHPLRFTSDKVSPCSSDSDV